MSKPLRALMIDDSPEDAELLAAHLHCCWPDLVWERVDTAGALTDALERQEWDFITCDWVMPKFSGPAALAILQQRRVDAPIIVVSGQVGEEYAVTAMRAGAHDFVGKSNLVRLCPAVKRELEDFEVRRARRQAEQAQRESEAKFSSFFDLCADLACIASLDGWFREVNPTFLRVLGYSKEELLSRPYIEFVHPDDRDSTQRVITEQLQQGKTVLRFDNRYLTKDGQPVWLEWTSQPSVARGVTFAIARDVSERKRAEEALERANVFLAEGQSLAHVGTWEYLAASRETYWSDEEFRIFGLTPGGKSPTYEELLKHHVHPDDVTLLDETFGNAVRNLSTFELEFRIVRPDGSVRVVLDRAQPHFDGQGKLLKYTGATLDITDRKQAELDYKTILDTASDGFWVLDVQGNILDVNQAYCQLSGYSRAELLTMSLREIEAQESPAEIARSIQQVIEVGHGRFEGRHRRKDGSVIDVEISTNFRDVAGGRFFAFLHDITKRKEVASALGESEARFRSFYDLGLIGMAITSPSQEWRLCNDYLCALLGYTADELAAKTWAELTHPEDLAKDEEQFSRVLAGEIDGYGLDKRFIRKDGGVVWSALSVKCLRHPDGTVKYFVAIVQDLSARKEAEAMLREFSSGLERRVDERTAELVAANSALESFVYSVSHDLRAPLRHIEGFASLLEKDVGPQPSKEQSRHLARLREAAERMDRMITALLKLSRIGLTDLDTRQLPLIDLVSAAFADLRTAMRGHEVAFVLQALPEVPGDPTLLRQLFDNLLGNALKFTRTVRAPKVEVGVERREGENVFYVRDNGVGFDATRNDRLFRPFQRFHTEDEFEGTGIGLSIARRIVERHGGHIWAESAPGQGATFWFTLG